MLNKYREINTKLLTILPSSGGFSLFFSVPYANSFNLKIKSNQFFASCPSHTLKKNSSQRKNKKQDDFPIAPI